MTPRKNGNSDTLYWIISLILIFTGAGAPIGILMLVLKLLGGDRRRSSGSYYSQQQGPVGARTTWEPIPTRNGGRVPPMPGARQQWQPPQQGQTQQPQQAPQQPRQGAGMQPPPRARETGPQSQTWGAQQTGAQAAPQAAPAAQKNSALTKASFKSTLMIVIGAIVTAIFGIAAPSGVADTLGYLIDGYTSMFLSELSYTLPALCFLFAGIGILVSGLRRRKQVRRFRSLLAMVGKKKSISLSTLASATGLSVSRVRDDVAAMLDAGIFPQGFLDVGGDRLILSGEGLLEEEPVEKKKDEEVEVSAEDEILQEIREVNGIVMNEKLSAQIDRIGEITAKILEYQRNHPERAPQLHSFLSYYLPTTLKILRAYGQLESQKIEGQNITAAMKRIEDMMDKVVEGFERQLDQLFQGDAMDITSDVEVLERMLAKDGLSGKDGVTGSDGITLTL